METAITFSLSLPTSWAELTSAQQIYAYFLLSEGYDAAAIRSFCQLYFNFEEPVLKPVEKDSDIPMYMKQYKDLKAKHPDALLLFRTGDFYTSFEEDAVNAADSLGITLTKSKGFRQASFPHHALDTYLPKLIRCGFRVAICDLITAPKKGR